MLLANRDNREFPAQSDIAKGTNMADSDEFKDHLQLGTTRLATLLTAAQLVSSFAVVTAWCGRVPDWDDSLELLWKGTGSQDWKPTPGSTPPTFGVGSATLARMLSSQNHGRYKGKLDQNLLINLNPCTVAGLADVLTW
jgi:hypothetical protein